MLPEISGSITTRFAAAGLAALLGAGSIAHAQLEPDRVYYGLGRAVPMVVTHPADVEGEAEIWLLDRHDEHLASAGVIEGRVDLAALFSEFWDERELRYAQLVIDGEKIGPGVVLQPLLTPSLAANAGRGAVTWYHPDPAKGEVVFSGLRTYVDKLVVLETSEGDITLRLRPDVAPNSAWNFRSLVRDGFYTDIPFHRVVPVSQSGAPFVAQAGDPTGTGGGGPGYYIDLEPSSLRHDFGVLSMARSGDPNTNGSQFFLGLSREATLHLDGLYTAFGEAVQGAAAITRIEQTPQLEGSDQHRPASPPRIIEARLIDAPPRGQGPDPVQRPEPAPINR